LNDLIADPSQRSLLQTILPIFICPTDTGVNLNPHRRLDPTGANLAVAKANYVGNMGVGRISPSEGVLFFRSNIRFRSITDGLSNTFAVGERASGEIDGGGNCGAGLWIGATGFPCTGTSLPNDCTIALYGNVSYLLQNGESLDPGTADLPFWTFSSKHVGGAHFLMCDGSVKFINQDIESKIGNFGLPSTWGVYQLLGSRNDDRSVGNF